MEHSVDACKLIGLFPYIVTLNVGLVTLIVLLQFKPPLTICTYLYLCSGNMNLVQQLRHMIRNQRNLGQITLSVQHCNSVELTLIFLYGFYLNVSILAELS